MTIQQHVSSIAEYKRCAFLKYCNENDINKHQLDELSISNNHHKLGLFYWFIIWIIIFILKTYDSFVYVRGSTD